MVVNKRGTRCERDATNESLLGFGKRREKTNLLVIIQSLSFSFEAQCLFFATQPKKTMISFASSFLLLRAGPSVSPPCLH